MSGDLFAHGGSGPLKDQRVFLIQIHSDRIELGYSLLLSPSSSEGARSEADADHNQVIDDSEKALLGETWRAKAGRSLHVSIDGTEQSLHFETAKVSLDGTAVNASLVTVAMKAIVDAGSSGAHSLEITDDLAQTQNGDVDVQVWARGSAKITEPGSADGKSWSIHRHANAADLRAPITLHFTGGGRDTPWTRTAGIFAAAVAALIGVALLVRRLVFARRVESK